MPKDTRQTTAPDLPPPQLKCPDCDSALRYRQSFVAGPGTQTEQWDLLDCDNCHRRFEYRHKGKILRRADPGV